MATKLPTRRLTLMAPVESMSAKFALQKETCKNQPSNINQQADQTPPPSFKYFGTRIMRRQTRAAGAYQVQGFYFRKNARTSALTQKESANRTAFVVASQSATATLENLAVVSQIQADFANKGYGSVVPVPIRQGVNSANYATIRGWVFAVRMAQIADDVEITPTTNTWTF